MPKGSKHILLTFLVLLAGLPPLSAGQTPPPEKKLPAGPAAPQSTHYPILILAFGNNPNWALRIGQKGPERLDRPGYPPIPLEPSDVAHEAGADSWTYHAKDSATGAAVAVHLTREACADAANDALAPAPAPAPPPAKYSFRASVDHAQIGSLRGCARIAAELFPKINNQPDDEDDADKKKPPAPTVTNFKPPFAVAYSSPAGKIIFKRGAITHVVGATSYQLAVSHDGKRLLYTHEDKGGDRAILVYDFATEKSIELLRGSVQQAFWSPDDTRFAFMKFVDGKWRLWLAPFSNPENAVSVYPGEIISIHGWADARTILVDDFVQLSWISEDGTIQRSLALKDPYGDVFGNSSINKIRVHPLNSDLLLVSGDIFVPPPGTPKDPHTGGSTGFCLYEILSKRRVLMTPPNMFAQDAEWSRDGLQIFFTGSDTSKRTFVYKVFWDGTGLQKYTSGMGLVAGQ
jgi:uncharacterized membrane protein